MDGRSQWSRGLRRVSAAARFLGLLVRIPPRAWTFVVNVVCCQVEVSVSGLSLVQRSPTECGVSECDRESSTMMRSWSTGGCCATVKRKTRPVNVSLKRCITKAVNTYKRLWTFPNTDPPLTSLE